MSPQRSLEPQPAKPIERSVTGNSRGEAMSPALRQDFEARFGADFSDVRIHADEKANASALALGARAYSVGPDVVFASGHYAPHTNEGRKLLAHELYHVKQDGGRRPAASEPLVVDSPDSPQERQAEAAAQSAVSGAPRVHQAAAAPRHGPPVLHRSLLGASI